AAGAIPGARGWGSTMPTPEPASARSIASAPFIRPPRGSCPPATGESPRRGGEVTRPATGESPRRGGEVTRPATGRHPPAAGSYRPATEESPDREHGAGLGHRPAPAV